MSDLTIVMLRAHHETDLSDAAVQRLIDDAEAQIVAEIGERTTQVDTFEGENTATAVFLTRPAETITSVIEGRKSGDELIETVLASDDYELRHSGHQLVRLLDGTNPYRYWGDLVVVTYAPKDDLARRLGVTIDLVKLAIEYTGVDEQKIGDFSYKTDRYERKRSALIARLDDSIGMS